MFSSAQAESLCRVPSREFDHRRNRNQLPYVGPRLKRYGRRDYLPVQCLFVLIQNQIVCNWDVHISEAAHLVRQINAKAFDQWDLVRTDCFLVKLERAPGIFDVWLCDSAGLKDFLTEPPQEEFQWSKEALEAGERMRTQGASDAEIGTLMMSIEGERLTKHYRQQPRKYWVLHLTGILDRMEQTAKDLSIALPPREDRSAWFGTAVK